MSAQLPDGHVVVVAGSNGCSVAALLAVADPDRVRRLVLCWPATAADPVEDARMRAHLTERGAPSDVVDTLLAGTTLRGLRDDEVAGIAGPVGLVPAVPESPAHQRRTVDAVRTLLPGAAELPGFPEPLHPDSPVHMAEFVNRIADFIEPAVRQGD
jgi:pimeloyl-ACP methyl ester carboxylesterase